MVNSIGLSEKEAAALHAAAITRNYALQPRLGILGNESL
jgi:hypothetical protein